MQAAALSDLGPDLVKRASDLTGAAAGLGTDRLLPVSEQFKTLLPGYGLRRGSVVGVTGSVPGTTSLLLALLAQASTAGSWCAMVGMPALGYVAAAETGIVLDRLALVPEPGPDWPNVVAALIDGFDLVVLALNRVGGRIAASACAQMAARARRRGSVLVPFGTGWDGAEVALSLIDSAWDGVGEGSGRKVTITTRGRGAAALGRRADMWLPAPANSGQYFGPSGVEPVNAGPAALELAGDGVNPSGGNAGRVALELAGDGVNPSGGGNAGRVTLELASDGGNADGSVNAGGGIGNSVNAGPAAAVAEPTNAGPAHLRIVS